MRAHELTILACALGILGGCGPDDRPQDRCRLEPTFVVTLVPDEGRVFPDDTVVRFEYGGGVETYALNETRTRLVVFCEPQFPTPGAGGAGSSSAVAGDSGAGGADSNSPAAIVCELWTAGATKVDVQARGFAPLEEEQQLLQVNATECTVRETLVVPLEPELQPRE